jgi:hypothetical protein
VTGAVIPGVGGLRGGSYCIFDAHYLYFGSTTCGLSSWIIDGVHPSFSVVTVLAEVDVITILHYAFPLPVCYYDEPVLLFVLVWVQAR